MPQAIRKKLLNHFLYDDCKICQNINKKKFLRKNPRLIISFYYIFFKQNKTWPTQTSDH